MDEKRKEGADPSRCFPFSLFHLPPPFLLPHKGRRAERKKEIHVRDQHTERKVHLVTHSILPSIPVVKTLSVRVPAPWEEWAQGAAR